MLERHAHSQYRFLVYTVFVGGVGGWGGGVNESMTQKCKVRLVICILISCQNANMELCGLLVTCIFMCPSSPQILCMWKASVVLVCIANLYIDKNGFIYTAVVVHQPQKPLRDKTP